MLQSRGIDGDGGGAGGNSRVTRQPAMMTGGGTGGEESAGRLPPRPSLGVRADSLVAAHFAMTEVVVVVLLFFISVVGGLLPSPPS